MDVAACRVALDFCKHFKPTIRIHGGDCFDFRWLRKSASEDEKRLSPKGDVASGVDFIREYKPTHFLTGNHELRICRGVDSNDGKLAELCTLLWDRILAELNGAIVLPYCKRRGILRIGDHAFLHGYSAGIYAVRKAALSYGNCVMGHVHRPESMPVERHERAVGHCSGCLCQLDMEYNVGQLGTLAQGHGFMYGFKLGNRVKLYRAEKIGGQWVMPSECVTYAKA